MCTLFISFCQPLDIINCQGSSACIRYPDKSSILVGNYTSDPFTTLKSNISILQIFVIKFVI
jgi:hypothetical protein